MNHACNDLSITKAQSLSRNGLAPNRLRGFGMTMIVMGISFIFYYLGFFGSVDGPLAPDKIGSAMAAWGVTRLHVITVLLLILSGAIGWNWILNLIHFARGSRLTCAAGKNTARGVCGTTAKRIRRVSRRSGKTVVEYVCTHGHRGSGAHFHPIKKGPSSHAIWLACLAFLLIAICYT